MSLVPSIEEVAEITHMLDTMAKARPGHVIITPGTYGDHLATMFLAIKGCKDTVGEVAQTTGDWRAYDRLCLYLEALGL